MRFLSALRAERVKFRRCPVWLAFVVFTLLAALLGTFNYAANLEVLHEGWYSLWTQHSFFACGLFLPGEIGVLCAWQWRLEHTGHCWNSLMTSPVPFAFLYLAKLFWSVVIMTLALGVAAVSYLLGGVAVGLAPGRFPPECAGWLAAGWVGCVAVCACQQLLSMLIRAFAPPVAVALVGGFGGLLLMARGYGLYWPYSLLCLGMRANDPNRALPAALFLLSCLLFTALPTAAALLIVRLRDVKSE